MEIVLAPVFAVFKNISTIPIKIPTPVNPCFIFSYSISDNSLHTDAKIFIPIANAFNPIAPFIIFPELEDNNRADTTTTAARPAIPSNPVFNCLVSKSETFFNALANIRTEKAIEIIDTTALPVPLKDKLVLFNIDKAPTNSINNMVIALIAELNFASSIPDNTTSDNVNTAIALAILSNRLALRFDCHICRLSRTESKIPATLPVSVLRLSSIPPPDFTKSPRKLSINFFALNNRPENITLFTILTNDSISPVLKASANPLPIVEHTSPILEPIFLRIFQILSRSLVNPLELPMDLIVSIKEEMNFVIFPITVPKTSVFLVDSFKLVIHSPIADAASRTNCPIPEKFLAMSKAPFANDLNRSIPILIAENTPLKTFLIFSAFSPLNFSFDVNSFKFFVNSVSPFICSFIDFLGNISRKTSFIGFTTLSIPSNMFLNEAKRSSLPPFFFHPSRTLFLASDVLSINPPNTLDKSVNNPLASLKSPTIISQVFPQPD